MVRQEWEKQLSQESEDSERRYDKKAADYDRSRISWDGRWPEDCIKWI